MKNWFGFLFVTHLSGVPLKSNPEGVLEWMEIEQVNRLPLWDGDRHFLPFVFDGDSRPFHGVMP